MSVTEYPSVSAEVSARIQAARAEVQEAMRIMDALVSDLLPDDGVNDVDWLEQIDQLLDELDPATDTQAA
jgi:hypothetical protein